jgi:hypothetical protein
MFSSDSQERRGLSAMSKRLDRGVRRKPYVPPKLTYFGQMSEIVMASPGSAPHKGTGSSGSVFRGWKDSY